MGRNEKLCCGRVGFEVSVQHANGDRNQAVEKLGLQVGVWKSADGYLTTAASSL